MNQKNTLINYLNLLNKIISDSDLTGLENLFHDLKTLFNKCNLDINKIILKSFSDGIEIVNRYKNDTFVKILIGIDEITLSFFFEVVS